MKKCIYKVFDFAAEEGFDLFKLFSDEPHVFFLDSSLYEDKRGRYSFIGFDPFEVFQGDRDGSLMDLKKRFLSFASFQREEFTPLSCGIVGILGYEYGLRQENVLLRGKEGFNIPEMVFGFYDCILTLDHRDKKLYVTSSGLPEQEESARITRAEERLNYIVKKIELRAKASSVFKEFQGSDFSEDVKFTSELSKAEYCGIVHKALDYITRGDIYQVNLSQRFSFDLNGKDIDVRNIYQSLRRLSPSSFSSYFNGGIFQIISSSPERFLKVKKNIVQTRPMKGTRPRGKDTRQDEALREEIINSAKDKAELLMITDLLRNDLGRVCEYGSVRVKDMRMIEEYATVFQATSAVEGVLRKDKDCFDVIKACFPGGSITGCPKIRALEIIEELEPIRRGIYTGSLGYMSFSGDMDFNILIRTLLVYQEKLYFHVGGGVVADSTPEGEYEETLVKAKAMKECLERI